MIKRELSYEEILCLQYVGMTSSQIMRQKYDELEFAEAFELYIDKAETLITIQQERGVETISFQDDDFPQSLRKIGTDCPAMIHCLGNFSLLNPDEKRIAIIGARAASPAGNQKAYELGKKYAKEGYVIVSGLAWGCDKSAHEGCLDVGGKTIAIVASGLNIVHPKENEPIQQRILENGGLLSQNSRLGLKPIRQGLLPEIGYKQPCRMLLSWLNVRIRVVVCTPCALPVNTTKNVSWLPIQNILI